MSEIRVTTLKDTSGGNSSSTADIFSGRAKAWVNFNGVSTVAIRANFNVNSITDNGTGDYTVNFTNALADADFTTVCSNRYDASGNNNAHTVVDINNYAKTSSTVRLIVRSPSNQQVYDAQEISCTNFR